MHTYPATPEVLSLVLVFINAHSLCMQAAIALVKLCGCAGSSEPPSLFDAISYKISCAAGLYRHVCDFFKDSYNASKFETITCLNMLSGKSKTELYSGNAMSELMFT